MGKKWTPHVEGNSRGKNFHRGNKKASDNNSNNVRYQPNGLFNLMASTVMVILGVALAWSLISSGIGYVSSAIKASKTVKDISQTVDNIHDKVDDTKHKVDKATAKKSKVYNETDLNSDIADEVIEKAKDKILDQYDIKNIDYVHLVKFENADTIEGYTENIVEKLSEDANDSHLFIVYNSDVLDSEDAEDTHDWISFLMDETHSLEKSKYYNIGLITSSNIPYSGNIIHMILYS